MEYSVAIRTLGKAGDKYQTTLDSLLSQTIPPKAIYIYLAEGFDRPKETIGVEKIVFVKKGMVAQRALNYEEIETPYILFLDDDVFLPSDAIEKLYNELTEYNGDVISPCVFYNHKISLKKKIILSILGREFARPFKSRWAYKVMSNAGFSYNNNPAKGVYESQSNAGPCFFCSKLDFLRICYGEESWLEKSPYAFPDDQVMFYKMYCMGLKVLTSFDSGILHLDASSTVSDIDEKTVKIVYSEYRNKLIFWHRFIFKPAANPIKKIWATLAISYTFGVQALKYALLYLLGKKTIANAFFSGIKDAFAFLKSNEYKALTPIPSSK